MQSKNKSWILNPSLVAMVAFFAMFTTSCSEEEIQASSTVEDANEIGTFSKEIKVSDVNGNFIRFKIISDNEGILDSYSSENFIFKALTINDLSSDNGSSVVDGNQIEEEPFNTNGQDLITLKQELIELKIGEGYVGYELEVNWKAPEEFSDRGFDWHDFSVNAAQGARVTNNRCCWAIYWHLKKQQNSVWSDVVTNGKIKGGDSWPESNAAWTHVQVSIQYRQESHYTLTYIFV